MFCHLITLCESIESIVDDTSSTCVYNLNVKLAGSRAASSAKNLIVPVSHLEYRVVALKVSLYQLKMGRVPVSGVRRSTYDCSKLVLCSQMVDMSRLPSKNTVHS